MMDFWFVDTTTGGNFLVEVDDDFIPTALYRAWEIAKQEFDTPHFVMSLSPTEAKMFDSLFDTLKDRGKRGG